MYKNKKGFTLIELLIVIAIIGILSAVVLLVLNPTLQRTKANETVLRSNVDKICLAFGACKMSAADPATQCINMTQLGVTDPVGIPTGSTYAYTALTATWGGTLGTCIFECNPGTNAIQIRALATCNIQ